MKTAILFLLLINTSIFSQTTWFSQNSGITNALRSTYFVNSLTGFACGDSGRILKTTNGGDNWFSISIDNITGYPARLNSVYFLNSNTGVIVGGIPTNNGGVSLKTTNGGTNWSIDIAFVFNMRSVFFSSSVIGYAVGGGFPTQTIICKSINSGNSWSEQYRENSENYLNSVFFINLNTGYAGGNFGTLYKTSNGGINWNLQTSNVTHIIHSIKFVNDSVGYIACSGGKVLKTTTSGQTWLINSVLGTADEFFSLDFTSLNIGFLVGQGSTIVKTVNGGNSWEAEISPSNQTLNSVFFTDINTGYAVGEGGAIIKTTNGGNSYSGIAINIKLLMEGMYNSTFNLLSRKDSIIFYLRDATSPFALRDSAKNTIDTISFSNLFNFPNATSGIYYIVAKHFNCVETWSKFGGENLIPNTVIYDYDFTNLISQAYGNNLKLKGSKYCIYSGDVNQDNSVNLTDLIAVYNRARHFDTGNRLPEDLTGDSVVDLSDLTLCYNNSASFVRVITP